MCNTQFHNQQRKPANLIGDSSEFNVACIAYSDPIADSSEFNVACTAHSDPLTIATGAMFTAVGGRAVKGVTRRPSPGRIT